MTDDADDADDAGALARDDARDDDRGRFSAWYPVHHAHRHAPSAPGVFQIRQARGLAVYPRGKSAMLFYGCAADLTAGVRDFHARHPGHAGEYLCRHQVFDAVPAAESLYRELLARFHARFGALPRLHAGAGESE
jgi:hypothetical protein